MFLMVTRSPLLSEEDNIQNTTDKNYTVSYIAMYDDIQVQNV